MTCPVCMDMIFSTYTINCGSPVPHVICHGCEIQYRLATPATSQGRCLKCPLCRVVESTPGNRSAASFQAELNSVYSQLASPVPELPRSIQAERLEWCQNMNINSCSTKSKTRRKCKYPTGCIRKVCRSCNVCLSHFDF